MKMFNMETLLMKLFIVLAFYVKDSQAFSFNAIYQKKNLSSRSLTGPSRSVNIDRIGAVSSSLGTSTTLNILKILCTKRQLLCGGKTIGTIFRTPQSG